MSAMPQSKTNVVGASIYAGFWRRVAAYMIDSLVLLIPLVLVSLVPSEAWVPLVQLAVWLVYKVLLEAGTHQATVGKRAMGIKVTDLDGGRISILRGVGRFFGLMLSGLILGIGFLMAAFTKKRQALHDLLASTLVVDARLEPAQITEDAAGGTMPMTAGVWVAVAVLLILPFGVGVLAAIAIPAYQDYSIRAKMSQVINEAALLKAEATDEIVRARSGSPGGAGSRKVAPISRYVSDVMIDSGAGAIRLGVDGAALGSSQIVSGAQLILALDRDGSQWKCSARGIPNRYLPATCRQ